MAPDLIFQLALECDLGNYPAATCQDTIQNTRTEIGQQELWSETNRLP